MSENEQMNQISYFSIYAFKTQYKTQKYYRALKFPFQLKKLPYGLIRNSQQLMIQNKIFEHNTKRRGLRYFECTLFNQRFTKISEKFKSQMIQNNWMRYVRVCDQKQINFLLINCIQFIFALLDILHKEIFNSFIKFQDLMKSISVLIILLYIAISSNAVYSPATALQLGYFSAASYQSAASIQSWTCSYCKKYPISDAKIFTNSTGGIQGFTGYSSQLNAVVVVFRGSNNIQNWIINIDAIRTTYSLCSGCSVHSGFYTGYNLVASPVRAAVQNLKAKYRTAKLYITGHSLGGALAIFATADLKNLFGNVDVTYTFGQPRIGNAAFASWFESTHPNVWRLVDYADIVPHLPPSNVGFLHSNKQAWYQRGMTSYQICDAEASNCANSIGSTAYSTDDHNLDNYLKLKGLGKKFNLIQKLEQIKSKGLQSIFKIVKQQKENEWKSQEQRKVNELLVELKRQEIKQA